MKFHGHYGILNVYLTGEVIYRVSKKQAKLFLLTTSDFHRIRQFLAQRWQIV